MLMKRGDFIKKLAVGILPVAFTGQVHASKKPNIVLMMADDFGIGDVAPYGPDGNSPVTENKFVENGGFKSGKKKKKRKANKAKK